MKLNLRNIELNDDYEVTTDNTILNMMDGTDMYSYIKHVVNPNLSQLTDLRGNKQVWLSMERHTERYKQYVSEYNPILWDIEEIEFEYVHDYYDRRVMEMDKLEDVQLSVQYHGLAAYTRNSAAENLNHIINNEDIVICGSDRAIGRIGIIFNGVAHRAFFCDVASDPDERNSSDKDASVSEELMYAMSGALIGKRQYIETFSTCKEVLAILCTHFKDDEEESEMRRIASNIGAHLIIGKKMLRAGKFGSGRNLLDHYLK